MMKILLIILRKLKLQLMKLIHIGQEFFSNWKGLDNFGGFIKDCLEACKDYL